MYAIRSYYDLPAPEGFIVTGVAVDGDARIDFATMALAGRRRQRRLDRLEDSYNFV